MTTSNSQKSAKSKCELTKEIIKDICLENNGVFTISKVKKVFEKQHPARKSIDVSDNVRMLTVNSQSRLSYLYIYGKPSTGTKLRNPKIKNSDSEYSRISSLKNKMDFLYDLGNGNYEIYEPSKHGVWEIVLGEDDVNRLRKIENNTNKNQLNYDSQVNRVFNSTENHQNNEITEKKDDIQPPLGCEKPKFSIQPTTVYERDQRVVAYILKLANGKCELCKNDAPFITSENTPYLEVHHVKSLANGGSDRICNAVALCPNCHRAVHYAKDKNLFLEELYEATHRLIPE